MAANQRTEASITNMRTEGPRTRQSSRYKTLKIELGAPPLMPSFNCIPLSPPKRPANMDQYLANLSCMEMSSGMPLIPFMQMPTPATNIANGSIEGLTLPQSMMLPPLVDLDTNLKMHAEWPFMPKIKITNNKSTKIKRGRKRKAEVLMFNPNLFPTLCDPFKDDFGFMMLGDKKFAKKFKKLYGGKQLTCKEQRKLDTGSYVQVFRGSKKYTKGGLTKKDLVRNKKGRIVSKRQQNHNPLKKWVSACRQAKLELKIPGFCPLNKGPNGKALYKRAKEIYAEIKARDAQAAEAAKATEMRSPKVHPNEKLITKLKGSIL